MYHNSFKDSKEEGRRTWRALENQWAEAMGFFGAMVTSFIGVIKKQFLGFLLFAIIFGSIGGVYGWLKKDIYSSQMTVSYAQLEKKIYGDMLFKLNQLIESKQFSNLAVLLNMTETQVGEIKSIEGINIHNKPLVNDISVEKVPFYIIVDVYNPDILPELQESLVNYISHSDFIFERLKLNERNYKNEIVHMKNQLAYMDSLKVLLLSDCAELDGDAVSNLDQLNKNQNEIFGRIRDLEAALQFNKNIEVMDGFIAQQESRNQKVLKYLLIGIAIGLGIRIFYLIIK